MHPGHLSPFYRRLLTNALTRNSACSTIKRETLGHHTNSYEIRFQIGQAPLASLATTTYHCYTPPTSTNPGNIGVDMATGRMAYIQCAVIYHIEIIFHSASDQPPHHAIPAVEKRFDFESRVGREGRETPHLDHGMSSLPDNLNFSLTLLETGRALLARVPQGQGRPGLL